MTVKFDLMEGMKQTIPFKMTNDNKHMFICNNNESLHQPYAALYNYEIM